MHVEQVRRLLSVAAPSQRGGGSTAEQASIKVHTAELGRGGGQSPFRLGSIDGGKEASLAIDHFVRGVGRVS